MNPNPVIHWPIIKHPNHDRQGFKSRNDNLALFCAERIFFDIFPTGGQVLRSNRANLDSNVHNA